MAIPSIRDYARYVREIKTTYLLSRDTLDSILKNSFNRRQSETVAIYCDPVSDGYRSMIEKTIKIKKHGRLSKFYFIQFGLCSNGYSTFIGFLEKFKKVLAVLES